MQKIVDDEEYYDQLFDGMACSQHVFNKVVFESCQFIDCCFKSSNLSLIKPNRSFFNEVEFNACKMTGINWNQARWSNIPLNCALFFNSCDISLSSFYELKLPELSLIDCKARDVDFRGCDLTSADFTQTDFEKSEFAHAILNKADFRESVNYMINPMENSLVGAKFSFPEVVNLLQVFNIEIDR